MTMTKITGKLIFYWWLWKLRLFVFTFGQDRKLLFNPWKFRVYVSVLVFLIGCSLFICFSSHFVCFSFIFSYLCSLFISFSSHFVCFSFIFCLSVFILSVLDFIFCLFSLATLLISGPSYKWRKKFSHSLRRW